MFGTFLVCWAAITLLAYAMYRVELAGKRTDSHLRELREALLMSQGQYVALAYGIVFVFVLLWVPRSSPRSSSRLERETGELAEIARRSPLGWLSSSSGPR